MQGSDEKSPDAYRTISEVAEVMALPQHVLRFWETRFPQIKPLKRGGGRRYYRRDDVELLKAIKSLLYDRGYTIRGVQKLLREQGVQRAISGEVEPAQPTSKAPAPRAEPNFAPPPPAPGPRSRLAGADAAKLRAALSELSEAERQLRLAREF